MHLIAWSSILFLAGRQFIPADLDHDPTVHPSPVLALAGTALAVVGSLLMALVALKWQAIVLATRTPSTGVAGLVASGGVVAIGAVLIYAARGRRAAVSSA
jgi:hypothetical protein